MFNSISKADIRTIVQEVFDDVLGGDEGVDKKELEKEVEGLNHKIRELEHKKSLEEREIQHLVKMKEEKIAIETEKKQLDLQAMFDKKVMELQKDYHEKVMKMLADEHAKMQEIYKQIMTRLPNVNLAIRKEIAEAQ
jgi:hypothetical protein